MPGRAPEIGDTFGPPALGRAFEAIEVGPLPALPGAPLGIEVVHGDSDILGVAVAGAEDDRLLLWPPGRHQMLEEIGSHRLDALRESDTGLEERRCVVL